MRAGAPSYGKARPLRADDFAAFEAAFGDDPLGHAARGDQGEEGRCDSVLPRAQAGVSLRLVSLIVRAAVADR